MLSKARSYKMRTCKKFIRFDGRDEAAWSAFKYATWTVRVAVQIRVGVIENARLRASAVDEESESISLEIEAQSMQSLQA